jgi:hypothetical protein
VGQKSTLKLEIPLSPALSQGPYQSNTQRKLINKFTAHTLMIHKFPSTQFPLKLCCLPQKQKFRPFTLQDQIKMN